MKPFLALALVLAAALAPLAGLPTAQAHVCDGPQSDCGNCKEGEDHVHGDGDSENGCMSDETQVFDSNYNKKGLPFVAPVLVIIAVALLAYVRGRR